MGIVTWLNPVAWFGALLVALPLAAHFFTRRRARRTPFPALRFVPRTRLVPAWSQRPNDLQLLTIRVLVLLLATAALARPALVDAGNNGANDRLARLVLVDTSASMQRSLATGTALDSARVLAAQLADSADDARLAFTSNIASAVGGAASWLQQSSAARRELVIVSDFPAGLLGLADLADVPDAVGVRLVRVASAGTMVEPLQIYSSGTIVDVDFDANDTTTRVRYGSARVLSEQLGRPLAVPVTVAASESANDSAALHVAAATIGRFVTSDTTSGMRVPLVLYFPTASGWSDARAQSAPVADPAFARVLARVRSDRVLQASVGNATAVDARLQNERPDHFLVVARNSSGDALVDAATDTTNGAPRLAIFAAVPAASPAAALVLASLQATAGAPVEAQEWDRRRMNDSTLRSLERSAVEVPGISVTAELGRWVWLLVLGALLLEAVVRRDRRRQEHHDVAAETGRAA